MGLVRSLSRRLEKLAGPGPGTGAIDLDVSAFFSAFASSHSLNVHIEKPGIVFRLDRGAFEEAIGEARKLAPDLAIKVSASGILLTLPGTSEAGPLIAHSMHLTGALQVIHKENIVQASFEEAPAQQAVSTILERHTQLLARISSIR